MRNSRESAGNGELNAETDEQADALPQTRVSQVVAPAPLIAVTDPGPAIEPVRELNLKRRDTESVQKIFDPVTDTHAPAGP